MAVVKNLSGIQGALTAAMNKIAALAEAPAHDAQLVEEALEFTAQASKLIAENVNP